MKVLLSILTLFLSLSLQAQETTQHMRFMGIPMDCDAETFAQKLVKEKGLKRDSHADSSTIVLKGDFSGYKDCSFFIRGIRNNPIGAVGVVFKEKESFYLVHSQYQTLKSKLQKKYGEPSSVDESFNGYEPSTDMGKLRAIQEGDAKFSVDFILDEGIINLQINSIDYNGYLQLIYYDKENVIEEIDKSMDDL